MRKKILIDIPDDTNFDWREAISLWKHFMPNSSSGHNETPCYSWKVMDSHGRAYVCNLCGIKCYTVVPGDDPPVGCIYRKGDSRWKPQSMREKGQWGDIDWDCWWDNDGVQV